MICINKLPAKQRNAAQRRSGARRCAALRGAARRRAVPRSAALRTAAQRCAQCECCLTYHVTYYVRRRQPVIDQQGLGLRGLIHKEAHPDYRMGFILYKL